MDEDGGSNHLQTLEKRRKKEKIGDQILISQKCVANILDPLNAPNVHSKCVWSANTSQNGLVQLSHLAFKICLLKKRILTFWIAVDVLNKIIQRFYTKVNERRR